MQNPVKNFSIRHYKHKYIGNVENWTCQKYACIFSAIQCQSLDSKNFKVKHKTLKCHFTENSLNLTPFAGCFLAWRWIF